MDSTSSTYLPTPSSTIAPEVDALFNFILLASFAIFVIVVAVTLYFSWRYRRKVAGDGLTYGVDHNIKLEILWTTIPTILILIVFVWGFKTYIKMNVVPGDAIEIKATGQKWFWTFDYKEGANLVNELVVPVNKPIKLLLSSQDVIHSLFVPAFRIKMDVLPNRYTITWFEATHTGEFDLFCTEFCGDGHSEMIGKVKVLPPDEYAIWLEKSSVLGEGLTLEEYGAELYKTKACYTCHSLDGSLIQGPSFKGRFGSELTMTDGTTVVSDENYLRESILNPRTKIAEGFKPIMPTFQGILKDRQIDALIAYIKAMNE